MGKRVKICGKKLWYLFHVRIFQSKLILLTDSWVITGGTDAGVMQQTGELLRAPNHVMDIENDATIIGIAAWEKIIEQSNMGKKKTT